jgi:dienelactone hydrolase
LIGHSFGGEVAPIVAASDPAIAAVVLMGAPARNFRETMKYQNRYLVDIDTTIPAAKKAAALERMTAQQEHNAASSVEKWRQWSQDRDPLPTARLVRCPVLILQGMTDRAVPPSDATLLENAIREAGNHRVAVRFFEKVNHHFQRDPVGARSGYDRLPTQDLAPEFLDALGEWLRRTLIVSR